MRVLAITSWNDSHENNRSRVVKSLAWVSIPNTFDGDSYLKMVAGSQGAAIFGAWTAIVKVASRSNPRGLLVKSDGQPYTPETLAHKTRLPAKWFKAAIERAMEVGWLEEIERQADVTATSLERYRDVTSLTIGGKGRKGGEGKKTPCSPPRGDDPDFEKWWKLYPRQRRGAKGVARRAWKKARKSISSERLLEALSRVVDSPKALGPFCPMASTWLNQDRWDDDPAVWEDDGNNKPKTTPLDVGAIEIERADG